MIRNTWVRWGLGCALGLLITVLPYVYFRISYTYQKRFRVVTEGKMYRSGCMTGNGLAAAIKDYKIRTVLNLMEEAPDPLLKPHFFAPASVKESEVVEKAGARMVTLTVKYLPRNKARTERPETIERYLELLDNPDNYPILVHCKAGLHRTGVLIAVYRMEYEGWTRQQALAEVKANGFGELASTSANEYIQQYVLGYRPHLRPGRVVERLPAVKGDLVSRPRTAPPGAFAPLPKD